MNEVVTRGMLKEELIEFKTGLKGELVELLSEFEGRIMTRMDLGFSDLNERLDAERAFTSDMWDDFSTRLAALEAK